MKWKKYLGSRLKSERKSWGMSRKRLARLSHVDEYDIEDIECGRNKNPNFYDMLNICDVLQSSVYFYLETEEKKAK